MSRNIGPTIEILLRRIRQEGGIALDPDLATQVYSHAEQITNTALQRVLVTDTLTVPKEKLLFSLRSEFSDAIDIVSFEKSNRHAIRVYSLDDFAAYEVGWFRSVAGTRFEAWMQLGRDLFILYPGQAAASSITITYTQLLTLYTSFAGSYTTASELPDEDVDIALALAELVLLVRYRLLTVVPKRLDRAIELLRQRGARI